MLISIPDASTISEINGVVSVTFASPVCTAGCFHATAPDAICIGCQPDPVKAKCPVCLVRFPGGVPVAVPGVVPDPPDEGNPIA